MRQFLLSFILLLLFILYSCEPPGGNNVLVVDEVYSINIDGGNLKKLSEWGGFSLAGNYLINNDGKLTEMDINGSNSHSLLPSNLTSHDFAVSPDETKIVLSTGSDIYLMNNDGTGLNKINLPDSLKYKQEPHLSFDNSEIAFISDSTIYKVDVNGNNLKRLLANRNANILYKLFSFSADNKDIIYSTQNTLTNYLIDLHLLNINSLADTVLFNANISNYEHPGLENSPGDIILFSYDNTFDQININNFAESTASGSNANYSYDYSKITFTDPDTSYIIRILDLAAHVNKKIKISLPKSKTAISITNSKICSDGETVIFACHREIFY